MNGVDRMVAREVERVLADYRAAARILGAENTLLRQRNGGLRGSLANSKELLRQCRMQPKAVTLPLFDMSDPNLVDKLRAL